MDALTSAPVGIKTVQYFVFILSLGYKDPAPLTGHYGEHSFLKQPHTSRLELECIYCLTQLSGGYIQGVTGGTDQTSGGCSLC